VNVIGQHEAVLEHVAEVQQDVLGQVAHGGDEKRAGMIDDPGVMGLDVGNHGRELQPAVTELLHAPPHRFQKRSRIEGAVFCPLGKGRRIAGIEYVDPFVVREKGHARVKAGR
jgi:hypothetical protein